MKTKQGDIIEIEYTGRVKDSNIVFDTTDENVAKENNLYRENINCKPVVMCVGEKEIVPGLDEFLVDKELDKEYEVELAPKDAFGEENPRLYRLVGADKFLKQNVKPYPGLQLNLDNAFCTVKAVSGGRVMLDFNHPLAGRTVIYKVKIIKIIQNPDEKIKAYLEKMVGKDTGFEFAGKKLTINAQINEQMQELISSKLKQVVKAIEEIEFKTV